MMNKVLVVSILFLVAFLSSSFSYAASSYTCGNYKVDIKQHSPVFVPGVKPPKIFNVKIVYASIKENCVVVSWNTDKPATSQVVYGYKGEASINAEKKFLGYLQGTPQNNSGTTQHIAILKNIKPNQAYEFQAVSKAHPHATPAVSGPIVFKIVPNQHTIKKQTQTIPSTVQNVARKTSSKPIMPSAVLSAKTTKDSKNTTPIKQGLDDSKQEPRLSTDFKTPTQKTNLADQDSIQKPKNSETYLTLTALGVYNQFKDSIKDNFIKDINLKDKKDTIQLQPDKDGQTTTLSVTATSTPKGFVKFSFLIPTLVLLGLLYLTQKVLLPYFGIIVEKPRVFWMTTVSLFAFVFLILGIFKTAFALFAVALAVAAWNALSELVEIAQDDTDQESTQESELSEDDSLQNESESSNASSELDGESEKQSSNNSEATNSESAQQEESSKDL